MLIHNFEWVVEGTVHLEMKAITNIGIYIYTHLVMCQVTDTNEFLKLHYIKCL